jgi:UDP-2,4-diacetamido-2,4,6-trideoxy-beta-L-altropyranose hydrolase
VTRRRTVVFRADAGPAIGTGHVGRCTTLAQELIGRGWHAILASQGIPDRLRAGVERAGMDVLALPDDGSLRADHDAIRAHVSHATLVVTDHYGIDASWQGRARDWSDVVMAIDDLAERPQDVDLLLDQNLGFDEAAHRRLLRDGARLLGGPRFALVAAGFAEARDGRAPATGAVHRILVFLSGADPDDVTRTAALGVASATAGTSISIDVVVGAAYPFVDRLTRWAARRSGVRVYVATDDMVGLTSAADLAVGAAGTASWERCTLGVPTVLLTLAPNQAGVAGGLAAAGAAIALGGADAAADVEPVVRDLLADPARVRAMSEAARTITDGRGRCRVADAIEELPAVRGAEPVQPARPA